MTDDQRKAQRRLVRLAEAGERRAFLRAARAQPGRDHVYSTHADCGDVDHSGRCPWDDGGLANCRVCGLAEGALTIHCPGAPPESPGVALVVYSGRLDYVAGEWIKIGPFAAGSAS